MSVTAADRWARRRELIAVVADANAELLRLLAIPLEGVDRIGEHVILDAVRGAAVRRSAAMAELLGRRGR